ncbi:hypothetical protein EELLY_v1c00480 [Entomoplasma ellychniae]|uniref:MtN3 and saliva related transmembrane protein n=1 Tax=Entomoplasma ellychniae TaxID=2114 RepID=A0A8E2QY23_9MOLU|nr:SemiSWEET family transporter [Entomoplasma ellychniae]PPE04374.1 hypothetical protein EELLY_v1c00480 [Entomoplasma ellychniae]
MIFLTENIDNIKATAAIFGYIGSVLASVFLIPQVYKVIKTKSIKDVSMVMTLIILFGTLIWLTYGILSGISSGWLLALPVIISNAAQLICSLILIILKLIYMGKINLVKNNKGEK